MSVHPKYLIDQIKKYAADPSEKNLREILQLLCCCSEDEFQEFFDCGFETFVRILNRPETIMIDLLEQKL